jgi:ribose transport system permease protein
MANGKQAYVGRTHNQSIATAETFSFRTVAYNVRLWGPLIALVLLCFGFGIADPSFATIENLKTIASRASIPTILAIGMTFIIIQGSIDLSIEGVMAASSLTFAMTVLNSRTGLDLGIFGVVSGIGVGTLCGLVNGFVVTFFRVPSFMVTLGIWSVSMGIAMLLSGGQPPLIHHQMLRSFGLGQMLGVPNLAIVALIFLVLGYILQTYTRFGRYSFVIGGGEDLARLTRIPVDRYKIMVFIFSGALAGLAGVLESARIGLGHVDIGLGQMFAAITAVVIGGTPLSGGRGGVLQSAIGVLILVVLSNGMIFVGISPYIQKSVQGAIILCAMLIATWHLRGRLRVVK